MHGPLIRSTLIMLLSALAFTDALVLYLHAPWLSPLVGLLFEVAVPFIAVMIIAFRVKEIVYE